MTDTESVNFWSTLDQKTLEIMITSKVKALVFQAAKDGDLHTLAHLRQTIDLQLLTACANASSHHYAGEKLTPLMICCKNGDHKVALDLLEGYRAKIDQIGKAVINDTLSSGVTALWCAVENGNSDLVKILLKRGANPNHRTSTDHHLMHSAGALRELEIAKTLVKYGAHVDEKDSENLTCLMRAASLQYEKTAMFLVDIGSDLLSKDLQGNSVLHYASSKEELGLLDKLVFLCPSLFLAKNKLGYTPLLWAAEHQCDKTVGFIIKHPSLAITSDDKAIALELLATSYIMDSTMYNIYKVESIFKRSLQFKDDQHILKDSWHSITVGLCGSNENNGVENDQQHTEHRINLWMQALHIRQKIFGMENPQRLVGIDRLHEYYSKLCESILSLHCEHVESNHLQKIPIVKELKNFCQLVNNIRAVNGEIQSSHFVHMTKHIYLSLVQHRLQNQEDSLEVHKAYSTIILYLIGLVNHDQKSLTCSTYRQIFQWIYKVIAGNHLNTPQSLLHMAVDKRTNDDCFIVNAVISFPSASVTMSLVQMGISPDVQDAEGNTPLHILAKQCVLVCSCFDTVETALALIKQGSATNIKNYIGKYPANLCQMESLKGSFQR